MFGLFWAFFLRCRERSKTDPKQYFSVMSGVAQNRPKTDSKTVFSVLSGVAQNRPQNRFKTAFFRDVEGDPQTGRRQYFGIFFPILAKMVPVAGRESLNPGIRRMVRNPD